MPRPRQSRRLLLSEGSRPEVSAVSRAFTAPCTCRAGGCRSQRKERARGQGAVRTWIALGKTPPLGCVQLPPASAGTEDAAAAPPAATEPRSPPLPLASPRRGGTHSQVHYHGFRTRDDEWIPDSGGSVHHAPQRAAHSPLRETHTHTHTHRRLALRLYAVVPATPTDTQRHLVISDSPSYIP